MAARSGPPLGVEGAGRGDPERRARVGARSFHRRRARASVLVASLDPARPACLRSPVCSRMGWGSWEERAGARVGCAQPLPDLAPAVRAQRAGRRSADVPRSHGLAGTNASRFRAGEGRADLGVLCHPAPQLGLLRPPTPHPPDTAHSSSPGAHSSLGSRERRGSGPPFKPARDWCLGEKQDIKY